MKLGDIVQASVVERVSGEVFIVNFNGRLMRVKNSSGLPMQADQGVKLRVTAIEPLAFQIVGPKRNIALDMNK